MNTTTTHPIVRPWSIKAAFWLFLGCLIFSLIGTIPSVIGLNSAEGRAKIEQNIRELSSEQRAGISVDDLVNTAIGTGIALFILFAVTSVAVNILTAFLTLTGKKAARIIATICAILGAFILLLGFTWPFLFAFLLFLLGTIFLWLTPSGEYFEQKKELRLMKQQESGNPPESL